MGEPAYISAIDKAIGFAARAHEKQRRKIGAVPYIAHPVAVAFILQQMDCTETVVIAGLLHDTVEDTKVTIEEVREKFGDKVAAIVAGCTEPPKKQFKWEERKVHMIVPLRHPPLPIKLVAAADKYHNLSHSLHNQRKKGLGLWKYFGKGEEQQAWYYRTVSESIAANVPNPEQYPIFEQLSTIVEEIFAGVSSRPPQISQN